jgi:hypothetical protein
MKSNATRNIDRSQVRKTRIQAAKDRPSSSALLGPRLEQAVREPKGYDQACRGASARLRTGSDPNRTPPRSRHELHER